MESVSTRRSTAHYTLIFPAVLGATIPGLVHAESKFWQWPVGVCSTWQTDSCWHGPGRPGSGDDVFIRDTFFGRQQVEINSATGDAWARDVYLMNGTFGSHIEQTGGHLHARSMFLATSDAFGAGASYAQRNGDVTLSETLSVGHQRNAQGQYSLHDGRLQTVNTVVGNKGEGTFEQRGGQHVADGLILGSQSVGSGRYVLQGGSLEARGASIGRRGSGEFEQSVHTAVSLDSLILGHYDTGDGTYALDGGLLEISGNVYSGAGRARLEITDRSIVRIAGDIRQGNTASPHVGFDGSGTSTLAINGGRLSVGDASGGHLSVDHFHLGEQAGDRGTYRHSGGFFEASKYLHVGLAGQGELRLEGGTYAVARHLHIGRLAGSDGSVVVDGAGTVLTGRNANVGNEGIGSLEIGNGATVRDVRAVIGAAVGSDGTARVHSGGSWISSETLEIGVSGRGSLSVESGGNVSSVDGRIAVNGGSSGSVYVTGAGARWDNTGDVVAGRDGSGLLAVSEGGQVSGSAGYAGQGTARWAMIDVRDAGSAVELAGDLYVGHSGTGRLQILDGGRVSNLTGYLGRNASGEGTATVIGVGSEWRNTGDVAVGSYGSGMLNIRDGGLVANQTAFVGTHAGSSGTVRLQGEGAHWAIADDLYIGGNLVGAGGDGVLTLTRGGSVQVNDTVTVYETGSLQLWGGDLRTGSLIAAPDAISFRDGTLQVHGGSFDHGRNEIMLNGHHSAANPTLMLSGGAEVVPRLAKVIVGDDAAAALKVAAGTQLESRDGFLGRQSGGNGAAAVEGAGAQWVVGHSLYVGGSPRVEGGTGDLAVLDGGEVGSLYHFLGYGAGAQGRLTVSGEGARVTADTLFVSGYEGTGIAEVRAGGTVQSASAIAGLAGGSDGSIAVAGPGSALRATWLESGRYGTGAVAVTGGAAIHADSVKVGVRAGGQGVIRVEDAGSRLRVAGDMSVGGSEAAAGGSGYVLLAGGSIDVERTIKLWQQGRLTLDHGHLAAQTIDAGAEGSIFDFNGGTLAVERFHGQLVNRGGTLAPGASPGRTEIVGDYVQHADATLAIEIGGLLAGAEHDVLDVTGTATLGGALSVSWYDLGLGTYVASAGDAFDILAAETLVGEFDLLALADLRTGLYWQIAYLQDQFGTTDVVRLSVVGAHVSNPGALWLFATGLFGVVRTVRRGRARH